MTPRPRQRLYTTARSYASLVGAGIGLGARDAVPSLERALESTLRVPHAVAMPMARTALYFAVRALIRPGQTVILSPYTIAEVVNMVICAGGVPVFADIERSTCNIDATQVERLLDDRTGAVLVTHFYGLACDVVAIRELCRRRNVPLIEDAAQAFGTTVAGQAAGTFGDVGVYSFGLFKNVTSFLGGAAVTSRSEVAAAMRAECAKLPMESVTHLGERALSGLIADVSTHPAAFPLTYAALRSVSLRSPTFIAQGMAIDTNPVLRRTMPARYLHRMRPVQARMIGRQLPRVPAHNALRVRAAEAYHARLHDIAELVLPPLRSDGSHIYTYYAIQAENRVALVRHLIEQRRDVAVSHHKNCADMACFAEFHRDCPNAAAAARTLIYVPTYPSYGLDEVARTAAAIRSFYGRS